MAKVALIFPPSLMRNFAIPLNLAYLAGSLEAKGHQVKIFDMSAKYWNLSSDQTIEIIKKYSPDIIGITTNVLFIKPTYNLVNKLKVLKSLIVLGGPHTSLLPEEAILNGADIAVRGEGELTIVELADYIDGKIKLSDIRGIVYSYKNKIIYNPPRPLIKNLDSIPFPSRHLFDKSLYVEDSEYYQAFGPIFSSRGCPAHCTYCYKGVFGDGIRLRSAQNVIEEMLEMYHKFNVKAFEFLDDSFSADPKRVIEICQLIKEKFPEPIKWQCTTRLDFTDKKLLEIMRSSGCFRVFYGFESGDKRTLKLVQKKIDVEQAVQVLNWTKQVGIKSIVGFMYGFPWETVEHVNNTTKIIKRLRRYVDEFNKVGILVPVPGTKLYNDYKDSYNLENWWLKDSYGKRYRQNIYYPYFRRNFYNDFALLEDGFFQFPKKVKKAIKKGIRTIGTHNIFHNNPLPIALILITMVYISKFLYAINPKLEEKIFFFLRKIKYKVLKKNAQIKNIPN